MTSEQAQIVDEETQVNAADALREARGAMYELLSAMRQLEVGFAERRMLDRIMAAKARLDIYLDFLHFAQHPFRPLTNHELAPVVHEVLELIQEARGVLCLEHELSLAGKAMRRLVKLIDPLEELHKQVDVMDVMCGV